VTTETDSGKNPRRRKLAEPVARLLGAEVTLAVVYKAVGEAVGAFKREYPERGKADREFVRWLFTEACVTTGMPVLAYGTYDDFAWAAYEFLGHSRADGYTGKRAPLAAETLASRFSMWRQVFDQEDEEGRYFAWEVKQAGVTFRVKLYLGVVQRRPAYVGAWFVVRRLGTGRFVTGQSAREAVAPDRQPPDPEVEAGRQHLAAEVRRTFRAGALRPGADPGALQKLERDVLQKLLVPLALAEEALPWFVEAVLDLLRTGRIGLREARLEHGRVGVLTEVAAALSVAVGEGACVADAETDEEAAHEAAALMTDVGLWGLMKQAELSDRMRAAGHPWYARHPDIADADGTPSSE